MTPEEFVKNFHEEKQRLVDLYFDKESPTDISAMIKSLSLDDNRLAALKEILAGVIRDAFYTTLLGLDGAAQIGGSQEKYRLTDEQGNELTGGEIESFAWEYFQN